MASIKICLSLAGHCRKVHSRAEYLGNDSSLTHFYDSLRFSAWKYKLFISVFRSTPTTDAPYVCNQCNWSFTQQQITYHHQREGVSGWFQFISAGHWETRLETSLIKNRIDSIKVELKIELKFKNER